MDKLKIKQNDTPCPGAQEQKMCRFVLKKKTIEQENCNRNQLNLGVHNILLC